MYVQVARRNSEYFNENHLKILRFLYLCILVKNSSTTIIVTMLTKLDSLILALSYLNNYCS